MKKTLILSSSLLLSLGLSLSAFADTMAPSKSMLENSNLPQSKNRPCLNIATSCESAGYRLSKVPGKNIWKDCVKPILAGKSISGVTASTDDINACKMKKAEHKSMMHDLKKMKESQTAPVSGGSATAPSTPSTPSANQ